MRNNTKSRDDYALVQLIAQGNAHAFEEVFEREMMSVYKLAYVHVKDEAVAEDITQETFSRLWTNASKWKPEAQIKTWLLKVSRNLSIDVLRKKKNDLKKQERFFVDQHTDLQTRQKHNYQIVMDRQQVSESINEALFSLPERQREALSLVYYTGCTGAEAAQVMGLTLSALESLLARARRNLRERLSEQRTELMESYDETY